jgi:hypothetical protein
MEAASQIWYDPYIFYHGNHKKKPPSQQLCKQAIQLIISDSIDRAFRKLLPIEEILQEYLANALNDDADSDLDDIESKSDSGSGSSGSGSGSEPSYSDFDSDSGSENEIDADPESAQEPAQGQFQGQDPLSLQNEVKTFNFGNPPGQQYIPPVPQQPVPQQPVPQQPVPQQPVPQQVTTFDQLGGYPQAGGHHDSSYSDSDSSESDSDSDSEHRPQHRSPPQQQQQHQYPGKGRDPGNNQGSREQKSYSFF